MMLGCSAKADGSNEDLRFLCNLPPAFLYI
jgi:hypothetical protein